ncbi:hypothetical protein Scep_012576 [Stephania cephalantha]|uniref:Uncharacterized protein n=1 Tax=Stephania cephalantha TaxID=152367 RepID=A0AAP0JFE0_9MAGN
MAAVAMARRDMLATTAATARGTAWSNGAVARCWADRSPTRQQQWTMRHDFDEALLRDGLLAKKTRGIGHGTMEAIVGCRVRISRREHDVLRTIWIAHGESK